MGLSLLDPMSLGFGKNVTADAVIFLLTNSPTNGEELVNPFLYTFIRDSKHINEFITPLGSHYQDFDDQAGVLLPAYISWETETHVYTEIKPRACNAGGGSSTETTIMYLRLPGKI